jgi:predicted ATPase
MAVRRPRSRFRRVVQYELNKITLNNFRSINNQQIAIKPLTIVVGGNSAGKSSLLKAVLLMAQAQREKNIPGEVALNGSWVRLEQFKSVVHRGNTDENITIGLNFSISHERRQVNRDLLLSTRSLNISEWSYMTMNDLTGELNYEIEIGKTDRNRGVAMVRSCTLENPGGRVEIRRPDQDGQSSVDMSGALRFQGQFDFSGREDIDSADITGAILSGAVVTQCAVERRMIDELVEEIIRKAQSRFAFRSFSSRDQIIDQQILEPDDYLDELFDLELRSDSSLKHWTASDVAGLIMGQLIGRRLETSGAEATLELVEELGVEQVAADMAKTIFPTAVYVFDKIWSSPDRYPTISKLLRDAVDNRAEKTGFESRMSDKDRAIGMFVNNAYSDLKYSIGYIEQHFVEVDPMWGTKISVISDKHQVVGAEELDTFLSRSVHFLGPLRAAPSSAADYSRRGSDRGVGPEGQHLAYQLMMNPIVSGFVWIDNSKDRQDLSVSIREVPLSAAMTYWVNELELATSVRAEEIPGVGDSIKLEVPGVETELSPNDVGVGVSQALPVIGAVLLANPGDLVVLEQPELHLHPDAQLQLAEFFVAAMNSGRRLLIESHSEHFLNKLRLMAARAETDVADELIEKVGFVFAERDTKSGVTEFREVQLTGDGSVQNWPSGFFDQGTNAAKELFLLRQKRSRT